MNKRFALAALLFAFVFLSCKTTDKQTPPLPIQQEEEVFSELKDLKSLNGHWENSKGQFFEYPYYSDGKKYLLYRTKVVDRTSEVEAKAQSQGLTLTQLMEKKDTLYQMTDKYGNKKLNPLAENGVEYGFRFINIKTEPVLEKKIGLAFEYLIPESILLHNRNVFSLNQDQTQLCFDGTFYLGCNSIDDLYGGGKNEIFYKK